MGVDLLRHLILEQTPKGRRRNAGKVNGERQRVVTENKSPAKLLAGLLLISLKVTIKGRVILSS